MQHGNVESVNKRRDTLVLIGICCVFSYWNEIILWIIDFSTIQCYWMHHNEQREHMVCISLRWLILLMIMSRGNCWNSICRLFIVRMKIFENLHHNRKRFYGNIQCASNFWFVLNKSVWLQAHALLLVIFYLSNAIFCHYFFSSKSPSILYKTHF